MRQDVKSEFLYTTVNENGGNSRKKGENTGLANVREVITNNKNLFFDRLLMNLENLHVLIDHYEGKYKIINDEIHNERYKWDAIEHFQHYWNIDADAFSTMFKEAFRKTINLIDNKIVQPTAGILECKIRRRDCKKVISKSLY